MLTAALTGEYAEPKLWLAKPPIVIERRYQLQMVFLKYFKYQWAIKRQH